MFSVQVSSRLRTQMTPLSSYVDLRTQVQEQVQENQLLMNEVSKDRAQLAMYQAAQGHGGEMMAALQQDARTVAAQAGLTPVIGPGLRITIQYDPSLPYIQQYAGLFEATADQQLGLLVNDLFANGAKAISINGQRLVTTSSIRLVTTINNITSLQVNTVPITMPYVVTVVGDVNRMQAVLTINEVVAQLALMQEQCTVTSFTGSRSVTVPGYNGPLPGTWAKEVQGR